MRRTMIVSLVLIAASTAYGQQAEPQAKPKSIEEITAREAARRNAKDRARRQEFPEAEAQAAALARRRAFANRQARAQAQAQALAEQQEMQLQQQAAYFQRMRQAQVARENAQDRDFVRRLRKGTEIAEGQRRVRQRIDQSTDFRGINGSK